MESLIKKLEDLKRDIVKAKDALNIGKKKERVDDLNFLINQDGFWQDNKKAVRISQELEGLRVEIENFEELENEIKDLKELASLLDSSIYDEIELRFQELEKKFEKLEFLLLFSEDSDSSNAIISIHSGTGGVDAQDWAEILERMYLRFAEKKGFKTEVLDRALGNEAGIKNSVIKISGPYAYGYLKSENGVHRLVRISPFDAEGMRHTSFAGVEVLPEVDDTLIEIDEKDLRIDAYKSSGPGGQSVNTTDSAIRIVHIPTNISVSCQSERSQHQNKERALSILKSKLYKKKEEEQKEKDRSIKGSAGQGTWGKQIRSYVFQPYQMVKDHRTDFSTPDISSVINGDLDDFIESYLSLALKDRNK